MPSKGWLSPAARRSSAFWACSFASEKTSRNAFKDEFLFSISARHASTSCTDVISPVASFFDASVIESSFKLLIFLYYFTHDIVAVFFFRKSFYEFLALAQCGRGHVLAHNVVIKRRRLFFFYIYLRNLSHILQNIRNIFLQALHLTLPELEPGQSS